MTTAPTADPLASTYAVVVNWNGGEDNLSCLRSLVEAGFRPERIVFVDNGSADGSLESARTLFESLIVIENGENRGFGEGANQGARRALELGARSVLFVNNDLTFDSETPARLAKEFEREPAVGIVGPRVLYADDPTRVWCAGGRLDYRQNLSTLLGHRGPDEARWQRTFDVDYVAGCAMLVRAEVFDQIGFLKAEYFAYMEDVEFCLRARRAGFVVRTVGEVVALHAPSSATGGGYNPRRKYMQGVNSIHFLREYGGAREWLRFWVFDGLTLFPLALWSLPFGRTRAVLAKGLGIVHGLQGQLVSAERLAAGRWPL